MKKIFKKILTLLIGFIFSICFIPFFSSCKSTKQYADIICLNDFHGWLEQSSSGTNPNRAPTIDALMSKYLEIQTEDTSLNAKTNTTYFILNGDNAQGTAISNLSNPKGYATYQLLKEFNPQFSSVGNHEFDWGQDYLDPSKQQEYIHDTFQEMGGLESFLACNIFNENTDQIVDWVKPYSIVNINNIKVGFVGYTTPETKETSSKINLEGLKFYDGTKQDGQQIVQDAIDSCRKDADVVILLAHEGATKLSTGEIDHDSFIFKLINNLSGIDACLSAHTHLSYVENALDKNNKNVLVGQAGKYGDELLQTKIYHEKNQYSIQMNIINNNINYSFNQFPNCHNQKLKNIDQQYQQLQKNLEPILQQTRGNFITDKDSIYYNQSLNCITIPYKSDLEYFQDAQFSISGSLINESLGYVLSKSTLDKIDIFPELSSIKTQVTDPSFNGVDIAMTNDGGIRSQLNATKKNSDFNFGVTTSDLYETSPFDNITVICKVKIKDINDYFNQYRLANSADPFWSDKYLLGYPSGSTVRTSNQIKILDKQTHNPVDENTDVFLVLNQFFFLGGDNSRWNIAAQDNHWEISCFTGQNDKWDIFADARSTFIQYLYVLNNISSLQEQIPNLFLGSSESIPSWTYNNSNYCYPY